MRKSTRFLTLLTLVIASLFLIGTANAGDGQGEQKGFVDLNGDGFNDNMKDDDGDGIPNCVDEDYVKDSGDGTEDGTMTQSGNMYTYNLHNKLQSMYKITSCHMVFTERQAKLNGETPTDMGNAGALTDGTFNPGISDLTSQGKPEEAGQSGGK